MPKVTAQNQTFECSVGANLRKVLLANDIDLYNGKSKIINCRGIGSCGTCAVMITGEVSPSNWRDRTRRALPPHDSNNNLRLACQTQVFGDITVTKYAGFWGHQNQEVW